MMEVLKEKKEGNRKLKEDKYGISKDCHKGWVKSSEHDRAQ